MKLRGVLILSFSGQLRMVPTEMTVESWPSEPSLNQQLSHQQPAQQSSSTSLPDGQHDYCTPYPLYMSQYQGLHRQCRGSNISCSGSTDERERFRLHREHSALSRVGKMVRVGFSSISALPRVNVVTSEASDESGDQQLLRLSSTPGFQKCFTSLTITEVDWDRLSPEAEAALTRPKTALM